MSEPIVLPAELDVTTRWRECFQRNSVMCWRALSHILLAYARLQFADRCYTMANDLLTLAELAQQHAIILAPFEDVPEAA